MAYFSQKTPPSSSRTLTSKFSSSFSFHSSLLCVFSQLVQYPVIALFLTVSFCSASSLTATHNRQQMHGNERNTREEGDNFYSLFNAFIIIAAEAADIPPSQWTAPFNTRVCTSLVHSPEVLIHLNLATQSNLSMLYQAAPLLAFTTGVKPIAIRNPQATQEDRDNNVVANLFIRDTQSASGLEMVKAWFQSHGDDNCDIFIGPGVLKQSSTLHPMFEHAFDIDVDPKYQASVDSNRFNSMANTRQVSLLKSFIEQTSWRNFFSVSGGMYEGDDVLLKKSLDLIDASSAKQIDGPSYTFHKKFDATDVLERQKEKAAADPNAPEPSLETALEEIVLEMYQKRWQSRVVVAFGVDPAVLHRLLQKHNLLNKFFFIFGGEACFEADSASSYSDAPPNTIPPSIIGTSPRNGVNRNKWASVESSVCLAPSALRSAVVEYREFWKNIAFENPDVANPEDRIVSQAYRDAIQPLISIGYAESDLLAMKNTLSTRTFFALEALFIASRIVNTYFAENKHQTYVGASATTDGSPNWALGDRVPPPPGGNGLEDNPSVIDDYTTPDYTKFAWDSTNIRNIFSGFAMYEQSDPAFSIFSTYIGSYPLKLTINSIQWSSTRRERRNAIHSVFKTLGIGPYAVMNLVQQHHDGGFFSPQADGTVLPHSLAGIYPNNDAGGDDDPVSLQIALYGVFTSSTGVGGVSDTPSFTIHPSNDTAQVESGDTAVKFPVKIFGQEFFFGVVTEKLADGTTVSRVGIIDAPADVAPRTLLESIPTHWIWIAIIIALCVLLLIGGIVLYLWYEKRLRRMATRHAPKDPSQPVAIIFTDIESSTALWAECPREMGAALDLHNQIVRQCIADHNGYEVKTIGDAFMIAFKLASDAVACAVTIQKALFDADWASAADDAEQKQRRLRREARRKQRRRAAEQKRLVRKSTGTNSNASSLANSPKSNNDGSKNKNSNPGNGVSLENSMAPSAGAAMIEEKMKQRRRASNGARGLGRNALDSGSEMSAASDDDSDGDLDGDPRFPNTARILNDFYRRSHAMRKLSSQQQQQQQGKHPFAILGNEQQQQQQQTATEGSNSNRQTRRSGGGFGGRGGDDGDIYYDPQRPSQVFLAGVASRVHVNFSNLTSPTDANNNNNTHTTPPLLAGAPMNSEGHKRNSSNSNSGGLSAAVGGGGMALNARRVESRSSVENPDVMLMVGAAQLQQQQQNARNSPRVTLSAAAVPLAVAAGGATATPATTSNAGGGIGGAVSLPSLAAQQQNSLQQRANATHVQHNGLRVRIGAAYGTVAIRRSIRDLTTGLNHDLPGGLDEETYSFKKTPASPTSKKNASTKVAVFVHDDDDGDPQKEAIIRATKLLKSGKAVISYDYFGSVVNMASRIEAIGHGGQTLLSRALLAAADLEFELVSSVRDQKEREAEERKREKLVAAGKMLPLSPLRFKLYGNDDPIEQTAAQYGGVGASPLLVVLPHNNNNAEGMAAITLPAVAVPIRHSVNNDMTMTDEANGNNINNNGNGDRMLIAVSGSNEDGLHTFDGDDEDTTAAAAAPSSTRNMQSQARGQNAASGNKKGGVGDNKNANSKILINRKIDLSPSTMTLALRKDLIVFTHGYVELRGLPESIEVIEIRSASYFSARAFPPLRLEKASYATTNAGNITAHQNQTNNNPNNTSGFAGRTTSNNPNAVFAIGNGNNSENGGLPVAGGGGGGGNQSPSLGGGGIYGFIASTARAADNNSDVNEKALFNLMAPAAASSSLSPSLFLHTHPSSSLFAASQLTLMMLNHDNQLIRQVAHLRHQREIEVRLGFYMIEALLSVLGKKEAAELYQLLLARWRVNLQRDARGIHLFPPSAAAAENSNDVSNNTNINLPPSQQANHINPLVPTAPAAAAANASAMSTPSLAAANINNNQNNPSPQLSPSIAAAHSGGGGIGGVNAVNNINTAAHYLETLTKALLASKMAPAAMLRFDRSEPLLGGSLQQQQQQPTTPNNHLNVSNNNNMNNDTTAAAAVMGQKPSNSPPPPMMMMMMNANIRTALPPPPPPHVDDEIQHHHPIEEENETIAIAMEENETTITMEEVVEFVAAPVVVVGGYLSLSPAVAVSAEQQQQQPFLEGEEGESSPPAQLEHGDKLNAAADPTAVAAIVADEPQQGAYLHQQQQQRVLENDSIWNQNGHRQQQQGGGGGEGEEEHSHVPLTNIFVQQQQEVLGPIDDNYYATSNVGEPLVTRQPQDYQQQRDNMLPPQHHLEEIQKEDIIVEQQEYVYPTATDGIHNNNNQQFGNEGGEVPRDDVHEYSFTEGGHADDNAVVMHNHNTVNSSNKATPPTAEEEGVKGGVGGGDEGGVGVLATAQDEVYDMQSFSATEVHEEG